MILVKVELHSARTGKVTELGRMEISNVGGSKDDVRASYRVELMRKGTTDHVQRRGVVENYPKLSYPIWELVKRALAAALP